MDTAQEVVTPEKEMAREAEVITPAMAAEQKKQRIADKKKQEHEEEVKRVHELAFPIYNSILPVVEKWMYDPTDTRDTIWVNIGYVTCDVSDYVKRLLERKYSQTYKIEKEWKDVCCNWNKQWCMYECCWTRRFYSIRVSLK
jgi:hypothetical protein